MATSTGFFNPLTGFQMETEAPWVRQQRMAQQRDLAQLALANELAKAQMAKDASVRQSEAYEKVGMEGAKAREADRSAKETAEQRDARRKRQSESEARRFAKGLQDDVDKAVEKFKGETKSRWFGRAPVPAHTPEEVADFRKDYAAKLAKDNRAVLNRYPQVKVNADDGTFEFTGDSALADAGDAEIAAEKGAIPGTPPAAGGANPAPGGSGVPEYGHKGDIGADGTTYFRRGPDGKEVGITRSEFFKGIGQIDPQNTPEAREKRKAAKGGADASESASPGGAAPKISGAGGAGIVDPDAVFSNPAIPDVLKPIVAAGAMLGNKVSSMVGPNVGSSAPAVPAMPFFQSNLPAGGLQGGAIPADGWPSLAPAMGEASPVGLAKVLSDPAILAALNGAATASGAAGFASSPAAIASSIGGIPAILGALRLVERARRSALGVR